MVRTQECVAGVDIPATIPIARDAEVATRGDVLSNTVHSTMAAKVAALLILQNGKIVAERYAPDHSTNSWTDSASMMKTITALLVGIAIHEGKIRSIDEPAATYLPAWSKDGRRAITIRNLLQMHSGLRPQGNMKILSPTRAISLWAPIWNMW